MVLPADSTVESRDSCVGEPGRRKAGTPSSSRFGRPGDITVPGTPASLGEVNSSFSPTPGVINIRGGDCNGRSSIIWEYPPHICLLFGGPQGSRKIHAHESHQCLFPSLLHPATDDSVSRVPESITPAVSRGVRPTLGKSGTHAA